MLRQRARLRRGYGGHAFFVVLIAVALARLAGADRRPIVETALVDGNIHPVSSDFMRSAIAKADADGAALIIFTLHTPGGLLDATRDINNAIITVFHGI